MPDCIAECLIQGGLGQGLRFGISKHFFGELVIFGFDGFAEHCLIVQVLCTVIPQCGCTCGLIDLEGSPQSLLFVTLRLNATSLAIFYESFSQGIKQLLYGLFSPVS